MGVELHVRMTPEDAEKLIQAWKEGELDHLKILNIMPAEPESPELPDKKWAGTETQRRQAPEQGR